MKFGRPIGVLVIIALVGVGGFFGAKALLDGGDSGPTPERSGVDALGGVSLDDLGRNGIHLSAPAAGYLARIGPDEAKRAANAFFRNVGVKQVLLADVKFDATGIATGTKHAWIVNFDPTDPHLQPPGQNGSTNTFAVAFIDADTGKFLDSIGEMAPEPPGTGHEGIKGSTPGAISTPDTPNARGTPAPPQ